MHHTKTILVALGLVSVVAASASATVYKQKGTTNHLPVAAVPAQVGVAAESYAELHHCGWVGPGGRAVYRCNLDSWSQQPIVVSQNHTMRRVCDWVGPGGRAVYMCLYQ